LQRSLVCLLIVVAQAQKVSAPVQFPSDPQQSTGDPQDSNLNHSSAEKEQSPYDRSDPRTARQEKQYPVKSLVRHGGSRLTLMI
jgi:hypothetical protein